MSIDSLKPFFLAKSVAVVGASNREGSVGATVMHKLKSFGYEGKIYPINPKSDTIADLPAFKDISSLPEAPELAVIAVPPAGVSGVMKELGEKGCKAVIILTAGTNDVREENGKTVTEQFMEYAREYGIRIVGPNCIGVVSPWEKLDASFILKYTKPGSLALVSQSGGLAASLVDWADYSGVGFSHFMSIGDRADVDFIDSMRYLKDEERCKGIIMYIESIDHPTDFMNAAIETSKVKPVFALKSGRVAEGAAAAASHTGALAGGDDAYEQAFRASGIQRLNTFEDIYIASETVSYMPEIKGNRLAILTNGGGPSVMAVDELISQGGKLAALDPKTIEELNQVLPSTWSHGNPVDIIGDAPASRYADALRILGKDKNVDGILVIFVPTGINSGAAVAEGFVPLIKEMGIKNVLTNWIGEGPDGTAGPLFNKAGIPTYKTPEAAVSGFMMMANHARIASSKLSLAENVPINKERQQKCDAIFSKVREEGRTILTELEAKEIFTYYDIPVAVAKLARTPEEAKDIHKTIAGKVVIKISSKDIVHKSDVGGVVVGLKTPEETAEATRKMLDLVAKTVPNAKIDGVAVQEMVERDDNTYEILIGVGSDPIFGRTILVGSGGVSVEVEKDTALSILPINKEQAMDAITRTRIYGKLKGFRNMKAVDTAKIADMMVAVSQMIAENEEIAETDVNPLFAGPERVVAVDARIVLKSKS